MRRAWNVYRKQRSINYAVRFYCPAPPKFQFVYLNRDQLSRYLWATRGRIWNSEKGRWRIARDDDPRLVGPEGARRVLRSPRAIAARRSMGRLILLGVYTGGRVGTLLATTYDDKGRAHVDWDRGVLERRGRSEAETTKRRPSVLIMPKMLRNILNWARRDDEAGITHLIHKEDGTPYDRPFSCYRWRTLDEDAGCGVHVTAHTLRHTCAMLLKAGGVSLWASADFLGTTTKIMEDRYGDWDIETQREAVKALSSGKCLRTVPFATILRSQGPKTLKARGTSPKPSKH